MTIKEQWESALNAVKYSNMPNKKKVHEVRRINRIVQVLERSNVPAR